MSNLTRLSLALSVAVALPSAARATNFDFVPIGSAAGAGEGGALNRRGDVTGGVFVSGAEHVVVWRHGQYSGAGTDLGGGGAQAIAAGPQAINDRGEIAGWLETAGFSRHAALWIDGTLTDLGSLGGSFAMANAINDRGLVVGQYEDAVGWHGFTWQRGALQTLSGLSPADATLAFDVNERGVIAGSSSAPSGLPRAVIWDHGQARALAPLGSATQAFAVNDLGQAVGNGFPTHGGSPFPVSWDPSGAATALPTFAGEGTAYDVSDLGQIVGESNANPTGPGNQHAVLWQAGTLVDLAPYAPAGWKLMFATSVNERGEIFGWAEHGGAFIPFLLVPRCD